MRKLFTSFVFLLALFLCAASYAGTTPITNYHISGKLVSVGPNQNGVQVCLIGTVTETGKVIAQPRCFKLNATRENQLLATALVASAEDNIVTFVVSDIIANSILYSISINVPTQ